ncbi:mitochondrial succinate dehydrogenase subunit C [Piedraia hortae CBS 480.64]|uniref:Mitochondrial succinate dehydrogenase subunit C n=1 Tax=Piedraia hortae CBS 480.64 TaxID=1314780 RepID=A0A6A7BXS0_9PEZI|nr:mitochondrial succinate dehydrogenase subunit C [Piedraia hortae CBS 480.64]
MLAQRTAQQALRRVAAQQPASRLLVPAVITSSRVVVNQRRPAVTQTFDKGGNEHDILVQQRVKRPVSPHLSIYRPQVTWILSALNRITGVALSGSLYAFGALYLVSPYLGWHLESAVLAAAFAKWPVSLQALTKFIVSWPFTFHCMNGIRHLAWDTTSMLSNSKVRMTGWAVVGLSAASALALAIM